MRIFSLNKKASSIIAFVFWIAVWQIVSMIVNNSIVVASPVDTIRALASLIFTSEFWIAILNSTAKIAVGFIAALIIGAALAFASAAVPFIKSLVEPLARVIKAAPVASFIIMALLWVRSQWLSSFISFLMVWPVVFVNILGGISSADSKLIEAAGVFRTPASKKIKNIYFPAVFPYFCTACNVGLGLGWKAGVAAEVIVLPRSTIGEQLYYSKLYLNTADLFAYTAIIIIISFIFEKLFNRLFSKLSSRYTRGSEHENTAD